MPPPGSPPRSTAAVTRRGRAGRRVGVLGGPSAPLLPIRIPAQPTPLIGRDREVRAIGEQLLRADVRLLTLTGPAGTGKTRLALQVASELLARFRHGAFLVDLAPITDPRLVASEIARTLGVRELHNQPLLENLKGAVSGKRLLLLIDNFEQVV